MKMTLARKSLLLFVAATLCASFAYAYQDEEQPAEEAGDTFTSSKVVIKREPIRIIDPSRYQLPLRLEPVTSIDVKTLAPGVVRSIVVKVGDDVREQAELIRLDSTELELKVRAAGARFQIAEIEAKIASRAGSDEENLAKARTDAARAELELAEHQLKAAVAYTPIAGKVLDIHVVPGQIVQPGDVLATIADVSKLRVDIPVDRTEVSRGGNLEVQVEDTSVSGSVERILPLDLRLSTLRFLLNSPVLARTVIDNGLGNLNVGQTVHAAAIPRQPLVQVPTSAVAPGSTSERRVQVLRDGVVLDIPVELNGQAGLDRVYVSGPFAHGDIAIVETSEPLVDGTVVTPAGTAGRGGGAGGGRSQLGGTRETGTTPPAGGRPRVGF